MSIPAKLFMAAIFALPALGMAEERPVCDTEFGWCMPAEADATEGPCACRVDGEAISGTIRVLENPNLLVELQSDKVRTTRSLLPQQTFASRGFAGPSQLPPSDYKAYGVVIFKTRASRFNRERHLLICEAYLSALPHSSELAIDTSEQMVTIWPVSRDATADAINAPDGPPVEICETAVDEYGLVHAQNALRVLEQYRQAEGEYDSSGRGPFLAAWTPGSGIGQPDSLAMLVDFSEIEHPEEARDLFVLWRDRIQDNPELWEGPVERETLVDAIRRFFDRQGVILEAFGSL